MLPSDYLKQGWCQGTSGQTADGRVAGLAEQAVRWCMLGAIRQALNDGHLTMGQKDTLYHQLHSSQRQLCQLARRAGPHPSRSNRADGSRRAAGARSG